MIWYNCNMPSVVIYFYFLTWKQLTPLVCFFVQQGIAGEIGPPGQQGNPGVQVLQQLNLSQKQIIHWLHTLSLYWTLNVHNQSVHPTPQDDPRYSGM